MKNPDLNDTAIYCDLCGLHPDGSVQWDTHAAKAIVDGPTRHGPWAYMCKRHLQSGGFPGSPLNSHLKATTDPQTQVPKMTLGAVLKNKARGSK
jgi:hypothetical protein